MVSLCVQRTLHIVCQWCDIEMSITGLTDAICSQTGIVENWGIGKEIRSTFTQCKRSRLYWGNCLAHSSRASLLLPHLPLLIDHFSKVLPVLLHTPCCFKSKVTPFHASTLTHIGMCLFQAVWSLNDVIKSLNPLMM